MKDHADGVTAAGAQPAHAVTEVDAIGAARALHRTMMHGKRDRVTLLERNHLGAGRRHTVGVIFHDAK